MKKQIMALIIAFFALPHLSVASGDFDTRCFESPDGYGETVMIDRTEGVNKVMSSYQGASSSAAHFASCVAILGTGISLSMVRDTCGCWEAARDICSPPSSIRSWRRMGSDCKAFFPWGSY